MILKSTRYGFNSTQPFNPLIITGSEFPCIFATFRCLSFALMAQIPEIPARSQLPSFPTSLLISRMLLWHFFSPPAASHKLRKFLLRASKKNVIGTTVVKRCWVEVEWRRLLWPHLISLYVSSTLIKV